MKTERGKVTLALLALYFIWGSTFLVIRIALEGMPPLLIAGLRYTIAGGLLYAWARLRGTPGPTRTEWRSAASVGTLLVAANAAVVLAEQWVSSGVAAVALASLPIWIALFAGLFGKWPTGSEWIGLAVGLTGVVVLQTGGDLRASPPGAVLLVISCAAWSLGSMLGSRLRLPHGLISSGAQMLVGGVLVLVVALVRGERMTALPPAHSMAALAYLIVVGSLIAYTSYQFLLKTVPPPLAASYAYVNPLVALALGSLVYGEPVTPRAVGALVMILGGVALLALKSTRALTAPPPARSLKPEAPQKPESTPVRSPA